MLDTIEKRPIRLAGITLSGFTTSESRQLTLDDMVGRQPSIRKKSLDRATLDIQRKYGGNAIKTGDELIAEKRFEKKEEP